MTSVPDEYYSHGMFKTTIPNPEEPVSVSLVSGELISVQANHGFTTRNDRPPFLIPVAALSSGSWLWRSHPDFGRGALTRILVAALSPGSWSLRSHPDPCRGALTRILVAALSPGSREHNHALMYSRIIFMFPCQPNVIINHVRLGLCSTE